MTAVPQAPAKSEAPPEAKAPAADRLEGRIAWLLFGGGFFALLFTEKPAGFVRDESVYFHAARLYAEWFKKLMSSPSEALTDASIAGLWGFNHEHPGLMKSLFGVSGLVLEGLLRPAGAMRVPAFAFAALALPLIYLLARRLVARPPAVFAAVSFLLVPRQFFEAHLACFDVPVASMWLLVVFCFVNALERPRWWLYTGLAFGGALATKHNAFFIPVVLIPFSLWRGWHSSKGAPEARASFLAVNGVYVAGVLAYGVMVLALGPQRFQQSFLLLSPQVTVFVAASAGAGLLLRRLYLQKVETFRAVAPLVAMATAGPVLFYLHWPWLWHHPVDRAAEYFAFHLRHEHYTWFYLGELLREPPFPLEYVVVVTALTVPTAFFVPMVMGLFRVGFRAFKREVTLLEVLIVANAAASIIIISQPDVPHFGGVKHWFPSMPFLAVLMAVALERGAQELQAFRPKLSQASVATALAALCAVPAVIATWRVYPYGTSFYSELSGGLPGAASLGMQRQFWANNVTGVLPWINEHARPGDRVYLHECHNLQVGDYQRNGMLRTDLQFVSDPFSADIVAYQYHQEFREHEFNTWQALGTSKPAYGLYVDETPQVVVYQRQR